MIWLMKETSLIAHLYREATMYERSYCGASVLDCNPHSMHTEEEEHYEVVNGVHVPLQHRRCRRCASARWLQVEL